MLTNTATVSSSTPDDTPANDSDDATTGVVAEADVSVTKTVSADPFVPGQPLTYTITVTNNGPSDAQAVTMTDPVPTGLTVTSASATVGTCLIGDPVTCDLGSLTPGTTVEITVEATTDSSIVGVVSNTVSVSSTTTDPGPGPNQSTVTTTPTPTADLAVSKSVSPSVGVAAGGDLTYTVTLTNLGDSTAFDVELIDVLPAEIVYVGHVGDPVGSCNYEVAGTTVRCAATSLLPGATISVAIVVTVDAGAAIGVDIVNTATKTSTTPDDDSTNDTASTTTPVTTVADVSIDKTLLTDPLVPGQSAQYELVVTNDGPSSADSVVITDSVPVGLTITGTVTTQGSCTDDGISLTCTAGTVAAGGSVTVTVNVDVASDVTGDIVNTATVDSTITDPDPSNNSDTTTDAPVPSADLVITKTTATGALVPGRDVDYVLSVDNAGPSDAHDVVVTDVMPAGLTATAAVPSQGTCDIVGDTVTCDGGSLAAGASFTISISADIDPGVAGSVTNTASVESTTTSDPDDTNNSSTVIDDVFPSADLSLVKTVSTPTFVPGSSLTYTLTLTNLGPSDAVDVIVSDALPAGLTPTSASTPAGSCTIVGADVDCIIDRVGTDETVIVTVVVDTDPGLTEAVTNTAQVSSSTPDPIADNNTSVVSADPTPLSDLTIVKTGPARADGGTSGVYTLTVRNTGSSTATGVVVTDTLDTGMNYVDATGACTAIAGVVTCLPGDLEPGSKAEFEIRVEFDEVSESVKLTNRATVTADTTDPDPRNNTSTVSTTLTPESATLTGTVWNDTNGDGERDPGEVGIGDVTITVTGGPDGIDTVITLVTNPDGTYSTELPPGEWVVDVDPTTHPFGLTPTTPLTSTVTLAAGDSATVETGLGAGTITGRVWLDLDGDGVIDPNETDIPGVRVTAVCPGADGVIGTADDMTYSIITQGSFTFDGVPLQACTITIDTSTLPDRYRQTFDLDGVLDHTTTVTVSEPGTSITVDFGYRVQNNIPVTGGETGLLLRLALTALVVGFALTLIGRRRTRREV